MEKSPSIFLRRTVRPQDCQNMIRWMENDHVSCYLNESATLQDDIQTLLHHSPDDMLTFHFNQHGPFYLVCDPDDQSIGHAKLSPLSSLRFEVVYVIGEEVLWHQGLGQQTLNRVLSAAFLEKRAHSVLARIDQDNIHSLALAQACGMKQTGMQSRMHVLEITEQEYFSRLSA